MGAESSIGMGGAALVRGGSKLAKESAAPLDGSSEEQDAEKAVRKNKERTTALENDLKALTEEQLAYASLRGKTLSRKIAEHTYSITFFDNAKQDSTSLGRWKGVGFTGPRTAEFTGGATCWQGPARTLKVTFECGLEAEIQDVNEPSRCVYAATVLHPA